MAKNYKVRVKAFNISREQIFFARELAAREGLNSQVEFIEDDYRNISGQFDVFASVGMLEHVGAEHYRELGRVIHRAVGTCGRGLLHFIGRNRPGTFSPWIRKRIFPGAYTPALREMLDLLEPWNFSVLDVENLRLHYEKTLQHWLSRFETSTDQITKMFGPEFVRAWRLYLAGSIAAFRVGTLQLFQVTFAGPECRHIPWTRAHLYGGSAGKGRTRMDSCDVLIVGAGPAGSSCAWGLRRAGLDLLILDKCIFPRNKVCGGWITPAVLEELQISHTEYSQGRVFQPLTGFRTSRMGGPEIETNYGKPISYGIRRVEFDEFLLARCGARISQGTPLKTLERSGDHWMVNRQIKTLFVVGAGGHFCPVARFLGADSHAEIAVVGQETEFEMTSRQADNCSIRPEVPELYFCPDMKGYGWCFRKQNYLNVGLGRLDPHGLPHHVADFVGFLKTNRKLGFDFPTPMQGHAYLLHCDNGRNVVGEGILLVGDAAGVAYSQSGEGIRPAIESGLLAAKAIIAAKGKYDHAALESYRSLLGVRFGRATVGWSATIGRHLPAPVISSAARLLLASKWFSRHVILDQWFLRRDEPAMNSQIAGLIG